MPTKQKNRSLLLPALKTNDLSLRWNWKTMSVSGTSPGEPSEARAKKTERSGEFLKLTAPISMDQTEFPDPELPHPPEVQQPIAAGLRR